MLPQLFSCKKYLDKKPNNSLTVPTSLNDLQALLDDVNTMNEQRTSSYGEASADDYFDDADVYNSMGTFYQNIYTWTPYNYNYPGDWAPLYNPIYNANYCLEQVNKVSPNGNEIQWNNIKGSALFFRSYYFLQVAWSFAKAYDDNTSTSDLGIVLRLTSDYNVPSVRSNVKQTYDQIIKDAKESIAYLPDNSSHPARPSKPAAYGLLARAYLSMRIYDSAAIYANLYLQLKNQLMDYNVAGGDVIDINSQTPFKSFNSEVAFYTSMNLSVYTHHPAAGANVDTLLYSNYSNNDLRKTAFFTPTANGYQSFKGNYQADAYSLFSGIATDEMYLIRAECYARSGNTSSALNDLNTLLVKRWKSGTFTPVTATDSNDALNTILTERRKELLLRGLRWSDIKRLNKENRNIVLKRLVGGHAFMLSPNNDKYALELPFDLINLTGMPQNPGWQ
jgi:hypothetical protein